MIKLVIISHTFWQRRFCERWHLLTKLYSDVDVTLLAPRKWAWGTDKGYTFGKPSITNGQAWEDERFRVKVIDMRQNGYFDWLSIELVNQLLIIQPDMVFFIGDHLQYPLVETILAAKLVARKAKIAAFSMRGLPSSFSRSTGSLKHRLLNSMDRVKWDIVRRNCDAIFCHYPYAQKLFIREGFEGPIYVQTQIGVDARMYRMHDEDRRRIREKYKVQDCFVFGSATRFSPQKGLFDILRALPSEGNWRYLMLGSGTREEEDAIHLEIDKLGIRDKVIMPGFVDWKDMPGYWSAMDCALHVPRTTGGWVETFSLALAQAMSTGIPVIGNDSGSVPYQLGPDGIVIPEGDIEALRRQMVRVMTNQDESRRTGELMRTRVLECFDIVHLTHCFHSTMIDILHDVYNPAKSDMTTFSPREWTNCIEKGPADDGKN